MTGTWASGWATGDIVTAAEFKKGAGSISDTTLGGSAANVDVSGIVATYAHLLVVVYGRSDTAAGAIALSMRYNGDSAANYDHQLARGIAATASAIETFAATAMSVGSLAANTAPANLFSSTIIFIPHYANSSNNKSCVSIVGHKAGATTGLLSAEVYGAHWRSNAAINRITLLPAAGLFVAGTRVTIYGMGA